MLVISESRLSVSYSVPLNSPAFESIPVLDEWRSDDSNDSAVSILLESAIGPELGSLWAAKSPALTIGTERVTRGPEEVREFVPPRVQFENGEAACARKPA